MLKTIRLAALAALKSRALTPMEVCIELSGDLVATLTAILTEATDKEKLRWEWLGLNCFAAKYNGQFFTWDQPNNEPPYLSINKKWVVQDNGSGAYGFDELQKAILSQYKKDLNRI